jgi:hypothetical protein
MIRPLRTPSWPPRTSSLRRGLHPDLADTTATALSWGPADGWITVAFDGAQVAHLTGLLFRTRAGPHVDGLLFSTFFGGHDSSWAPRTDQAADFADFVVSG